MKKFLIPLILSLLFVSCSNQNQTSTVNFTIPAETVEILLNETNINPDEPNFLQIECKLFGTYEATQTTTIEKTFEEFQESPEPIILTFAEVPIASKISAEVVIYNQSQLGNIRRYYGKSDSITVKANQNNLNVALEKTDDSLDIILGQIKFTLTADYFNEDGNALTPNTQIPENAYNIQDLSHITVTILAENIPTDATKTIILNGRTQDPTQLVVKDNTFTIYANNSYLLNGKNSLILQVEYNGIISTQEIIFTLFNEEA
jgi:hypothetical protein